MGNLNAFDAIWHPPFPAGEASPGSCGFRCDDCPHAR